MKKVTKSLAVALSATMLFGTSPVLAADDTYTSLEKENLTSLVSAFAESAADFADGTASADISLHLEDSGKALAALAPVDLKWLEDVRLASSGTEDGNMAYSETGVYANGEKICTLQCVTDTESAETFYRIPELSEKCIQITDMENTKTADGVSISFTGSQIPDEQTVKDILVKYGETMLSHVKNNAVEEEVLDIEGIHVPAKRYSGVMTAEDGKKMMEDIIKEAGKDKQLKEVLASNDGAYEKLLDFLNNGLASVEEMKDEAQVEATIWKGKDGTSIGHSLGLFNGETRLPLIVWQQANDNGKLGFYATVGGEVNGFTVHGTGNTVDGKQNMNYRVQMSDMPVFILEIAEKEPEVAFSGTYTLRADTENEMLESLKNMALVFSKAANDGMDVTFTSAEVPVAVLNIAEGEYEDFEHLDMPEATDVVDIESYMENVNLDEVSENLEKIGAPENLMEQITNYFSAEPLVEEQADETFSLDGTTGEPDKNMGDVSAPVIPN